MRIYKYRDNKTLREVNSVCRKKGLPIGIGTRDRAHLSKALNNRLFNWRDTSIPLPKKDGTLSKTSTMKVNKVTSVQSIVNYGSNIMRVYKHSLGDGKFNKEEFKDNWLLTQY